MSRFSPVLPLIGGGGNRLQPIAVDAVAHCFAQALAMPDTIPKTFDLVGPNALTLKQILDQILAVTGRHRLKMPLPIPVARLQAGVLEWVYPMLLKKAPPLNRDQIKMLQEDNVADPKPARERFEFESISFAEGIARYLSSG